jgi:hypothetical protein
MGSEHLDGSCQENPSFGRGDFLMDERERDVDKVWPAQESPDPDHPEFPDDEQGFQDWLAYVLEGVFYHVPLPYVRPGRYR